MYVSVSVCCIAMVEYGLSMTLKGSCAGSLVPNVLILRECGTFKRWGLAGCGGACL